MFRRAIKEVRSLAPPAGFILAAAFVTVAWSAFPSSAPGPTTAFRFGAIGLFIGFPLLAATSFGAEFRQRTLPLLLSQPVPRGRLWLEKWVPVVILSTLLAVVHLVSVRGVKAEDKAPLFVVVFFTATIVCSTGFWTLIAHSTIGGMTFSLAAVMLLELAGGFIAREISGTTGTRFLFADAPWLNTLRVLYCASAAWLGWRVFSRFEVADNALAAAIRAEAPEEIVPAGALRCRPSGMVANLLRVELRLHRPTFLVAALFALCWMTAMALFAVRPPGPALIEAVFTVLLTVYLPLAIVLAGTISIGDESALGLHELHLTLPVRTRTRWLVKLAVSVTISALLAFGLPAALGALTTATIGLQRSIVLLLPAPVAAGTIGTIVVLSFWAATLFGHTVRAAVATGIALAGLGFCWGAALLAGLGSGLFTSLLTSMMVSFQLPPQAFMTRAFLPPYGSLLVGSVFLLVLLVVTMRQSLVAYRHIRTDTRVIVRHVSQLAAAVVVAGFCLGAAMGAVRSQFASKPVIELRAAIRAVSARAEGTPFERTVTVDELVETGQLSAATKRWIAGSLISVRGTGDSGAAASTRRRFAASITFPNGRKTVLLIAQ
jgi:hypothetical protein